LGPGFRRDDASKRELQAAIALSYSDRFVPSRADSKRFEIFLIAETPNKTFSTFIENKRFSSSNP